MFRVIKAYVVIGTITGEGLDLAYNKPDPKELERYLKKHPFPLDMAYTEEDLKRDLLYGSGLYRLPLDIRKETIQYIEELINNLIY